MKSLKQKCDGYEKQLNALKKCDGYEKQLNALKTENLTLTTLIQEQRDMLQNLQKYNMTSTQQQQPTPDISVTTSDSTLIIGDSIIKDINENGLDNVSVACLPGGKVKTISESLAQKNTGNYDAIIIHGGTNDCTSDENVTNGVSCYREMVSNVQQRSPNTKIYISTICPRADKDEHQARVDKMNDKLKEIARETSNCNIINDDANFKLKNDEPDINSLNKSKLHLKPCGTKKLLMNFHAARPILKKQNFDNGTRRSSEFLGISKFRAEEEEIRSLRTMITPKLATGRTGDATSVGNKTIKRKTVSMVNL